RKVSLISINDGKWRCVCLTWGNRAGNWTLYLDGARRAYGSNVGTGQAISGGGRLVLGQEQKNSSAQFFNSTKSFIGNISQFFIQKKMSAKRLVKKLSSDCHGNIELDKSVVFWSELLNKIRGQIQIQRNSTCNASGEESRFVLNFPARSTSNAVVPQASMPSMTAGTICWWMKNNLNNYNLFSYVAPSASNPALEIYFGIFWKFQLGLKSPKLSYEAPFIGDDYWHHLCAMWDTDTTEWSFYLDGVHQISQTKGHLSGYIVQGGGTFHLGQFVQNGAYKVAKAYQGLITGLNIWTTRLSSRTVAALAEEPGTEKGDALSWSMFRRGITGDVQIYNDYTLEMTARESDYTLRFPGFSNNSAYVKYNYDYAYVITSLSACAWFKTTASANEMTLLSYATSQHLSAIQWSIINGTTILMNINSWNPSLKNFKLSLLNTYNILRMFVSSVEVNSILNDGKWHHVCISWRSVGGSVWVYVDQRLDNTGSAYKTGEYIGRIGTFMIGQVQTSVGRSRIPSSDTTKAFVGEITRLNVWKNRMEVTERARILGRGCGFWNGNVLPWCELKSNLFGNVNLIPNSECFIPDVIVQERRNEMCQNRITPGLHCHGQKIYSIFDSDNQLNGGKRLRCYVEDALTSSELHYFKIYDTAGDSTCFQDLVQELLNITR
ncbi:unnamed protein product, partial [Porites lobata]